MTPKVVIDGYTVSSTLNSPATLPLGTTLNLVCRLSGIPHGQQTTYTWTCPNTPCQQTGYAGRKINNNIIAINTTSTSDGGTYNCTVTAGGVEASQQFQLNVEGKYLKPIIIVLYVHTCQSTGIHCSIHPLYIISHTTGGAVVHSYGRLILNEGVITDRHQLQPPNNDNEDGRIECTVSSGEAKFMYRGYTVSDADNRRATAAILVDFSNFDNTEGDCGDIYHYLFLSDGKTVKCSCILLHNMTEC